MSPARRRPSRTDRAAVTSPPPPAADNRTLLSPPKDGIESDQADPPTTAVFLASLPFMAFSVFWVLEEWAPHLVAGGDTAAATAVAIMAVVVMSIYKAVQDLGHTPSLLAVFLW